MTEQEHLQVAHRLNALADRLRLEGDDVAMAEMLWGAANRVTNAIAIQHELGSGNRLPRLGVVIYHLLNNHQGGANLRHGLQAAGILHGYFYNSHLTPDALVGYVADTQTFVADLLDLYDRYRSP